MSPSSQTSPQNLSSESYVSPQGTPGQQGQQPQQQPQNFVYVQPQPPQYHNSQQPQDLSQSNQQPLDFSNGGYFNHPVQVQVPAQNLNQPQQYSCGQQQGPLTPQTPNPSETPQPMTPQPMTPGSHGAVTPQPMTPQDQNSNSSGLMSPGSGYNYDARTPTQNYFMQSQSQQQVCYHLFHPLI